MSTAIWTKVHSDLGIADETLAKLLSCSVEEVEKWRAGDEPAPDAVERHLRAICSDGSLWHSALVDRPKASRVMLFGPLSRWLKPLLVGTTFVPFTILVVSFLLGQSFTTAPWLGQGVLLMTGAISVRLAMGLSRLMGPKCSVCGELVRAEDDSCSSCQAELV